MRSIPSPYNLIILNPYIEIALILSTALATTLVATARSTNINWRTFVFIISLQPWLFVRSSILPLLYRYGPLQKSARCQTFMLRSRAEKAIAALLAYKFMPEEILPQLNKPQPWSYCVKVVLKEWLILFIPMITAALCSGYVRIDFMQLRAKDLLAWSLNMLLVVSNEEVLSRYLVHNYLLFNLKQSPNIARLISSVAFGITHASDGPIMIVLSTFAGWFYAQAYDKAANLHAAMGIHFLVNFTHLCIASYPRYLAKNKPVKIFNTEKSLTLWQFFYGAALLGGYRFSKHTQLPALVIRQAQYIKAKTRQLIVQGLRKYRAIRDQQNKASGSTKSNKIQSIAVNTPAALLKNHRATNPHAAKNRNVSQYVSQFWANLLRVTTPNSRQPCP